MIDDSSLMQLDVDLGFEGMKEEIGNLQKCGAGKVIGQAEVKVDVAKCHACHHGANKRATRASPVP